MLNNGPPSAMMMTSFGGKNLPPTPSFQRGLAEAVRMMFDVPAVRTLVLASIACEIFAFSFATAVPAFARTIARGRAEE